MPRERSGKEGLLPPAVAFFLATGTLPPPGSPARAGGLIEAFLLRYNTDLDADTYARKLRTLWRRHQQEIRAVAPGSAPWVARVIDDPRLLDAAAPDEDDDEGADGGGR
jgi:hypothetical protein